MPVSIAIPAAPPIADSFLLAWLITRWMCVGQIVRALVHNGRPRDFPAERLRMLDKVHRKPTLTRVAFIPQRLCGEAIHDGAGASDRAFVGERANELLQLRRQKG